MDEREGIFREFHIREENSSFSPTVIACRSPLKLPKIASLGGEDERRVDHLPQGGAGSVKKGSSRATG